MDQAAHHLDLFFENPLDPDDVLQARRTEMDLVEDWVRDGYVTAAARRGTVEASQSTVPSLAPGNLGLLADW